MPFKFRPRAWHCRSSAARELKLPRVWTISWPRHRLVLLMRSPTQYAARCTSTNGTHGFGRHAILPCLTRTVHFLVLHETGASKSIGHCPISWFSLSQSCHRHCTLAKLPGKLFGTSTLGPLCGATVRWDTHDVCTLNPKNFRCLLLALHDRGVSFGAFPLWSEVGVSKCVGHCPISWFSRPSWCRRRCTPALLLVNGSVLLLQCHNLVKHALMRTPIPNTPLDNLAA